MALKSNAIKSGQMNVIVVTFNTILVELEIDSEEVSSQDDKYTLFCSDDKSIFNNTLTVKDDHVLGDEFLTLKFTKLVSGHSYSLEIDPGAEGEPYYLMENVSLEDLLSGSFSYAGSEEEEEDPELEHYYDESEDQDLPYDDDDLDDEELVSDDWEMDSDEKLAEEWEQESDDAYSDADEEEDEEEA